MSLKEMLNHRRAVRVYDPSQPIDAEAVKECIALATLAPTSSNLQLWECYHITDKELIAKLGKACLSQTAVTTAQQLVVFVTRQDRYRKHAAEIVQFERGNIARNSPQDRVPHRIKEIEGYYNKLIPFLYARCFGLLGVFRKALMQCAGIFRPVPRQVLESDTSAIAHKSCALVAQTFMLAMAEKGLDTCPLEGFDSYRIKKALKLPCSCEINMVVSCGVRLEKGVRGERFRLPLDAFYHRI